MQALILQDTFLHSPHPSNSYVSLYILVKASLEIVQVQLSIPERSIFQRLDEVSLILNGKFELEISQILFRPSSVRHNTCFAWGTNRKFLKNGSSLNSGQWQNIYTSPRSGTYNRNVSFLEIAYNQLTPWRRILLEKLIITQLKFLPFMEPKGPLSCSQEPATGPYPQSDESSPQLPYTTFLR